MSTEKLLCRQCWAPMGDTFHCETCGRYRVNRRFLEDGLLDELPGVKPGRGVFPRGASKDGFYLTRQEGQAIVYFALTTNDVKFLKRLGIAID